MQQWEFKREHGWDENKMTLLGNEGWELVGVESFSGNYYLFKRPKNVSISTENQSDSVSKSFTQRKEWTMEEMFPGIGK